VFVGIVSVTAVVGGVGVAEFVIVHVEDLSLVLHPAAALVGLESPDLPLDGPLGEGRDVPVDAVKGASDLPPAGDKGAPGASAFRRALERVVEDEAGVSAERGEQGAQGRGDEAKSHVSLHPSSIRSRGRGDVPVPHGNSLSVGRSFDPRG
jgi:hypothetical protein